MLPVRVKAQMGCDHQWVWNGRPPGGQNSPQFPYRTGINVLSGCRVPLEMNHVGTWSGSDMFPHSRRHGMGAAQHTHPYSSSCHHTVRALRGVISCLLQEPLITRINLTVLCDQQTKDKKLAPRGSLPTRGECALHVTGKRGLRGCPGSGADHPPGRTAAWTFSGSNHLVLSVFPRA